MADSRRRLRERGIALAELMFSVGIGSVVAVGLAAMMFYSGRSFAALTNYVDLDHNSRIALDKMSREIRQTNRLISHSSTSLVFEDYDGSTLEYSYDPDAKTLNRTRAGVQDAKPLLTECDFIQFSIFQRNPIGGSYDQYPTASPATCKLVQLRWICSRKILGAAINTESVQSAKIVIRKQ